MNDAQWQLIETAAKGLFYKEGTIRQWKHRDHVPAAARLKLHREKEIPLEVFEGHS